jgi:hypothetical protein
LTPSKYKIYVFILLSHSVFSQNFSGITGSNYIGTNAIPTNPANVVDTRHSVFVSLSAIGIDFQNNLSEIKYGLDWLSEVMKPI